MNRPRRPRSASNVMTFTRPRPARASAARQWRQRSRLPSLKPVWLMVLVAALGLGYGEWRPHLPFLDPASTSALPPSEPGLRATGGFSLCGSGPRINCVVDGDTVYLGGRKIRLADIDTPEVFSPSCASERERGERASRRLLALLNQAPVTFERTGSRDSDVYGRDLRIAVSNGRSVGDRLVAEGLARPWDGARRSWCG